MSEMDIVLIAIESMPARGQDENGARGRAP
jgi:hypothetical protein